MDTGEVAQFLPHLDRVVDFSRNGGLFGAYNRVGETANGAMVCSGSFGGALFTEDDGAGTGKFFNLRGMPIGRVPVTGHVRGFSPDGTLLACGHGAHVAVYQLVAREPFDRVIARDVGRIVLDSAQRIFASAGWSGGHPAPTTTRAFHVSDGRAAGPEIDTGCQHLSACFLPGTVHLLTGGRKLAVGDTIDLLSAGGPGVAQLWDAVSGKRIAAPLDLPGEPWATLPHPSGKWIAVLCRDGSLLRLRPDLSSFETLTRLDLNLRSDTADKPQGHLEFSPDGARIHANGFGSTVWAIDASDGSAVFRTAGRAGEALRLAARDGLLFSPSAR